MTSKTSHRPTLVALYDFQGRSEHELSFREGDLFSFVDQSSDPEWYEVQGLTHAVYGMIPASYVASSPGADTPRKVETAIVVAVVFDFEPENENELLVRAGQQVRVLAHSEEWLLVESPQQGEPGFLPKSYVRRLHAPFQLTASHLQSVPTLQEWYQQQQASSNDSPLQSELEGRTVYTVESVHVSAHHLKPNSSMPSEFVYEVVVQRSQGLTHTLFRTYRQFYTLQKALIKNFPTEAGRQQPGDRILPYLPGPAEETEAVAHRRRIDLDAYMKQLLQLPALIRSSLYVLLFLLPRPGDSAVAVELQHPELLDSAQMPAILRFEDLLDKCSSSGDPFRRPSTASEDQSPYYETLRPTRDSTNPTSPFPLSAVSERKQSSPAPFVMQSTPNSPRADTSHRSAGASSSSGPTPYIKLKFMNGSSPSYYKVPSHVTWRSLQRKLQSTARPAFTHLYYMQQPQRTYTLIENDETFQAAVEAAHGRSVQLFTENGM